ncbi:hypothetical protein B9Z55_027854 [Caenorhabditis nigoni]|uniref:histone acetyltransferase n=1 Tax=Caenorhabditis nigoni TaxID=1611254 RepID=A0A2G5SDR5_9PELO|nr:hypothetical protein B9Z55_027854 [Caenorhabditis nigoni]
MNVNVDMSSSAERQLADDDNHRKDEQPEQEAESQNQHGSSSKAIKKQIKFTTEQKSTLFQIWREDGVPNQAVIKDLAERFGTTERKKRQNAASNIEEETSASKKPRIEDDSEAEDRESRCDVPATNVVDVPSEAAEVAVLTDLKAPNAEMDDVHLEVDADTRKSAFLKSTIDVMEGVYLEVVESAPETDEVVHASSEDAPQDGTVDTLAEIIDNEKTVAGVILNVAEDVPKAPEVENFDMRLENADDASLVHREAQQTGEVEVSSDNAEDGSPAKMNAPANNTVDVLSKVIKDGSRTEKRQNSTSDDGEERSATKRPLVDSEIADREQTNAEICEKENTTPPEVAPVDSEDSHVVLNASQLEKMTLSEAALKIMIQNEKYSEKLHRLHQELKTILEETEEKLHYSAIHQFFEKQIQSEQSDETSRKLRMVYKELTNMMVEQGFCCGKEYVYPLYNISCAAVQECSIKEGSVFYDWKGGEEISFCNRHFHAKKSTKIRQQDGTWLKKKEFTRKVHDEVESEAVLECETCEKFWHKICLQSARKNGLNECDGCRKILDLDQTVLAKNLIKCDVSKFIEDFLRANTEIPPLVTQTITVRVVRSKEIKEKVPESMRKFYSGKKRKNIPAKSYWFRKIYVFQNYKDQETFFFALDVSEHNSGYVSIDLLDSVKYFQPSKYRTKVYNTIIDGYFAYAASIGYQHAHIWADAPNKDGDFFFNVRPPLQTIPNQGKLENWYQQMLTDAKSVKSFGYNLKIDKLASFKAVYEYLWFSGFWRKKLEVDWDTDGLTLDELKMNILDEEKSKGHALMYIKLNSNKSAPRINLEGREEINSGEMLETDEKWTNFFVDGKLFFNNKIRAQHATLVIVNRLVAEQRKTMKYVAAIEQE